MKVILESTLLTARIRHTVNFCRKKKSIAAREEAKEYSNNSEMKVPESISNRNITKKKASNSSSKINGNQTESDFFFTRYISSRII